MRCACGTEPECGPHFRERLLSVGNGFTPSRGRGQVDPEKSKRWDRRLEDYRKVRKEGSQPQSTRRADIETAKVISDHEGKPFRAV